MAHEEASLSATDSGDDAERRDFLGFAGLLAMSGGLAAGYGTFGIMAGSFLFPAGHGNKAWQFVATIDSLRVGDALDYITPSGAKVVIARQAEGTDEDFIALSSVCPHLGCQVHWEPQHERFFCPCHNGAFDRQGQPLAGPPAAAKQQLTRFPLKIENGLLFIEAPMTSVTET